MSEHPPIEIILRELALFAATFGFQLKGGDLVPFARRISTEIAAWNRRLDEDKWISRRQCARLLGVSLPTLDGYIRHEGLPFRVKNPRARKKVHYLFNEREVAQWAKSHLAGVPTKSLK